jgi:hypothetical protein
VIPVTQPYCLRFGFRGVTVMTHPHP